MSAELRERLGDLADQVPTTSPPADLWDRGRRYGRRRTLTQVVVASCCLLLLAVGVSTAWHGFSKPDVAPANVDTPGHLPDRIFTPSPWTPGTDVAGPPGRLAAIHPSTRRVAEGWIGSREYVGIVGVSATDGSSRFLDLPTSTDERVPGEYGQVALSPDGTKVGFARFDGVDAEGFPVLTGWGVYDALTGEVQELEDPEAPEPTGGDFFEVEFTGDSHYLVTVYSRTKPATWRTDELVTWEVDTGERIVAEGPGKYWLPNMGSAPSGVLWTRGRTVYTFDPNSRRTTTVDLPHDTVDVSYAPGSAALAYLADTDGLAKAGAWSLFVGAGAADLERVDLPFEPSEILGWQGADRVVVGDGSGQVASVRLSVRQGSPLSLGWGDEGDFLDSQNIASDLWANDLVDGVRPADVEDPRHARIRTASAVLVVGGVASVGVVILLRRRRHGRP